MKILGIESSCDETSIAVLNNNDVLTNIVSSQELHGKYGGVVPEYASREHMRLIQILVSESFSRANVDINGIDAIAVTRGPGLMGALLVGLSFAKGLAYALEKPLLGVNHIEGHIMANFLNHKSLTFPFLCLLVSGGHTMIIYVEDYGNYQILGRSVDDAAGEAFDKAARILSIGFPGGPIIDQIAKNGSRDFYKFPRAKIKGSKTNFSFSGLKTSLFYLVKKKGNGWIQNNLPSICASYQEAIIDMLRRNTFLVAEDKKVDTIVLAGGVAANSRLREVFLEESNKKNIKIYFPSLEYCTDNAAMIARTGIEMLKRGITSPLNISAIPNLSLV
jgi:N6-L-threonylcarbamoyladenine synthase